MASWFERLKCWGRALGNDVVALWIAARDVRTPRLAKAVAAVVAAYALSPIDLIPDFIPILGYVDDLLLVPAGIALVVRLVPRELMSEFRVQAKLRGGRPTSYAAAAAVLALWLLAIVALASCWRRGAG